jgi:hypothetical protein
LPADHLGRDRSAPVCWFWLFTAMTGIFTPAYSVSKRTGSDGPPAYGVGL